MAKPMAFTKAGASGAPSDPQGGLVSSSAPGVGPAAGMSDALMITCPKCGDHFDAIQALEQDSGAEPDGDEGGV